MRNSVIAQRINSLNQQAEPNEKTSPVNENKIEPPVPDLTLKTSPIKNIDKIKFSLESPSQIQQAIQIDPALSDLSPSDIDPVKFTSISPIIETKEVDNSKENTNCYQPQSQNEDFVKQNILENDIYDASISTSSSNDPEDEDSDDKFSTIKRSPHSKNNVSEGSGDGSVKEHGELSRQNTVIENVNYKGNGHTNGTSTPDRNNIFFNTLN